MSTSKLLFLFMLCNVNIRPLWPKSRIIRSNKKLSLIILVEGLELNDNFLMQDTAALVTNGTRYYSISKMYRTTAILSIGYSSCIKHQNWLVSFFPRHAYEQEKTRNATAILNVLLRDYDNRLRPRFGGKLCLTEESWYAWARPNSSCAK